MTHPFHPNHNAADRLNTLLDALVSGKRAPDASASDMDTLAAVHRLVSGESAADVSATPSDDTLDEIWRTVMQIPATAPVHAGGTPPVSARQRARIRAAAERQRSSRIQFLLSMGAVATLLLVLIGAAWLGRDGNGSGPVDPEPGQYAAVPLGTATPEATPLTNDSWMTPIDPSGCTAEPMSSDEYVDIIRSDIDISWRSYEMVGPPAPERTSEAIPALRNYIACTSLPYEDFDENRVRTLTTDAFLWSNSNQVTANEATQHREEATGYDRMEEHFLSLPGASYRTVLETEAPQSVLDIWEGRQKLESTPKVIFGQSGEEFITVTGHPYGIDVFNPDLAMELADGRVVIPLTTIYWAEDPDIALLENREFSNIGLFIMVEEEGNWLLDELVMLCVEGCEPPATPVASPVVMPKE